ncbi:RGS domain-containing protein, partial [Tribonema minus]
RQLDLQSALCTPLVLTQLEGYCARTHTAENLEFLLKADGVKRLPPQSMELRQALQDVARVYIAAGGDKEVNLSAATKAKTRLLVEQHDPCSFDQAAKEIYKLTLTDIWPRFLLSPEFLAIAHRKELRV